MNNKSFKQGMLLLSDVFTKELTADLLKIYWDVFQGYDGEAFNRAVTSHIKTGKHFPRPADLIELIEGNPKLKADTAWQLVLKALRDSENAVLPPDIQEVVTALGGTRYLGHLSMRDLEFKRLEFKESFNPSTTLGIEQQ